MKKSILFIIPSLSAGGAERTLINLFNRIDFSIYEIDLLLILNKGQYLSQVPTQVRIIPLFDISFVVRILSFLQKKVGLVYFFRSRMKRMPEKHYNVAISFLDSNFTDLLFLYKQIDKRYTWVHASVKNNNNYYRYYKYKKYRDKVIRERYSLLDGIRFVSIDAMNEFKEIFGEFPNMSVVYNIISVEEIKKKALEEINYENDIFTFIAIGSLYTVKGFDRLIRATKFVCDQGYTIKVRIIGSGPEYKKLLKLVKVLSLSDTVALMGYQKNPYSFLSHANVFVMSSISEALPTALCEAMVLGIPVLVTNCSGCREIVDGGEFGLMANQNDSDFAMRMIEYIKNPALLRKYSIKSLERAAIFNDDRTLQKYYEVFNC